MYNSGGVSDVPTVGLTTSKYKYNTHWPIYTGTCTPVFHSLTQVVKKVAMHCAGWRAHSVKIHHDKWYRVT
eukprot:SAG11_NODE_686_length_7720_cov_1.748327_9_plen_70_part_01